MKQALKKKWMIGGLLLVSASLLTGCSGNDTQFTLKGVKNVQEMIFFKYKNKVEVYCPTGICTFSISANKATDVNVEMYTDKMKPFKKLEGINLTSDTNATVKRESTATFSLKLPEKDTAVKIQAIDYYRQ
jgi:hypothetical protein